MNDVFILILYNNSYLFYCLFIIIHEVTVNRIVCYYNHINKII